MEDDRQKKVLLMRTGIVIFMVLLFSVWAYNLKNVWLGAPSLSSTGANDNGAAWSNLKNDLSRVLTDTKSQLQEIEKARTTKEQSDQTALINNLLGGVGKLAAATSSIAATSSAGTIIATSTAGVKDKVTCPESINCMPTIGAARPCKVPAGCEHITIIAY